MGPDLGKSTAEENQKKKAPFVIWTRDLLIKMYVLYHSATTATTAAPQWLLDRESTNLAFFAKKHFLLLSE